ncbi:hypothetical protein ABEB36_009481 [Hypothenemus hampei]|uniref:Uncharacterized protein n=1 Tax=Hypothenemus hampei TaxID=57062 RepID=A0ABD1EH56_HYPHA
MAHRAIIASRPGAALTRTIQIDGLGEMVQSVGPQISRSHFNRFFLWGYVKNIVYGEPPTTVENMRDRISNAFQTITPQMIENVYLSFERRLNCVSKEMEISLNFYCEY